MIFRFSLGNRIAAQRYLQQFQELYTEEGRKSVKISTYVANQQQQQQQQQSQQQQSSSSTIVTTTLSQAQSVANNQQAVDTSSNVAKIATSQTLPSAIFTQGNTYILTNAIGMTAHSVSTGIVSAVNTSLQNASSASISNAFTITGKNRHFCSVW